jgi:putative membrane protein
MMWWNHGAWGAGDWLAMIFMMVVFWGLIVALMIWVVRSARSDRVGGSQTTSDSRRADEVLAERFARGEIDEDEFIHRRHALHSTSGRQ